MALPLPITALFLVCIFVVCSLLRTGRVSTSRFNMQILLLLACGLLLCAYAMLWNHWRRARVLLAGLPSYPQLPFVGNLHQFFGDGRRLFRRLAEMSEMVEQKMMPFVLWFGPYPILMTNDPDDVKSITNAFVEKPYYYSFGKVWLGDGLVLASGSIWKQNIKKLAGTFTAAVVDGYQGMFNAQAHKLVERLKDEVGREPFDIMHDLAQTTLEAICQTALGVSNISENIVTAEYYRAFNRSLELFISRGLNLFLHPDFIFRLTPTHRELKRCVAVIHNVSDTIINKRKLERIEMKKNRTLDESKNGKLRNEETKFKAFLDILMELSETDPTLTEKQIKSEVDTIIVGGQETVASTLFYSLLMIGCKRDVQDKLYAELQEIFRGSIRPIQKEDLSRMHYCEAVINETLRMFPPFPVVMRYADRELQLKSCRIPAGTACGINAWGAGRSRRAWGPDALQFRPERWLYGEQPPANPAAFLAFSYGRRACIGKKYGMAILKTVLAYCVRELEFISEADKMEMKVDIVLKPVSGHLIQVRLREPKL